MKKLLCFAVCVTLALGARFTGAGECYPDPCEETSVFCDPCDEVSCLPCDPCENIFGPACGKKSLWDSVKVYGWLQAGITVNDHGNKNDYSGVSAIVKF